MLKRKNIVFAVIGAIIVILLMIILFGIQKKNEIEVEQLGIREIVGNTVEERLASHIDASNAKITKIENIDELKKKYSAIFKDAENENYIVELPDRLLIYDFEHDDIKAEFFVQNIDLGEKGLK